MGWCNRDALMEGRRLYSDDDVERLICARALVTEGHSIAQLAAQPTAELQRLVSRRTGGNAAAAEPAPVQQLTVVGQVLCATLKTHFQELVHGPEVIYHSETVLDWLKNGAPHEQGLIVETPTLQPPLARQLIEAHRRRIGPLIVVYGFANAFTLGFLAEHGVTTLPAPIRAEDLAMVLGASQVPMLRLESLLEAPAPALRFSQDSVALIAGSSPAIDCECPQHIAQLLTSIHAFEQYCAECETNNEQDAALHAFLGRVSGYSRALFEVALARVAAAEGFPLPELSSMGDAPSG